MQQAGPAELVHLLTHVAAFSCALAEYAFDTIMCWTRGMKRRAEAARITEPSAAESASTTPETVASPREAVMQSEATEAEPFIPSSALIVIDIKGGDDSSVEEAVPEPDIVTLPRWLIEAHARAAEEERLRSLNSLAHRFHARLAERFPDLARRSVSFNELAQSDKPLFSRFMAQIDPAVPLEDQVDIVLHGSPRGNIPSILAHGLNRNPPFYVTTCPATAQQYANRSGVQTDELIAFLAVKKTLSGGSYYPPSLNPGPYGAATGAPFWPARADAPLPTNAIFTTHQTPLPLFVTRFR